MTRFTQEQRWDHQRDLRKHEPNPRHQKTAVIDLVGYCHGLMTGPGGLLGPEIKAQLHARVRTVCLEFELDVPPAPTKAEEISSVMLPEVV